MIKIKNYNPQSFISIQETIEKTKTLQEAAKLIVQDAIESLEICSIF